MDKNIKMKDFVKDFNNCVVVDMESKTITLIKDEKITTTNNRDILKQIWASLE